ncbi:nudix domain-containing protein [Colletotrichum truncatum]|uniref:Nudix domain-containing protein n=1 Tax=Colletotrichum truncatum TaxID=5467 RepID=A0ACC3ZHG0_COLTU|nr:nudix domain-containing protein [Colletotrichum truncatum]KAF6790643.1 nudix domain-containing protein [Colletotrichum truncatum]
MAACEANPNAAKSEFLQTQQRHYPSNHILISCGTVPVDPSTRKIAVLRDSVDSTVWLPKGRKEIGEDLLATALRETREETGLKVEALPLKVATRATPSQALEGTFPVGENPDVTDGLLNSEPSSVCVYPCIYTGALKMVFWFAAKVDEGDVPVEVAQAPWDENVRLEWVKARDVAAMMAFKADGDVIEKVLADMRNSGYDI